MHLFGVVQVPRTSLKLLEPHLCRDSKVCRVVTHEFGVVRLYRTITNYIFTGEAQCVRCLCTCSEWFKCIEPPRTFQNHIIAEIARCVEFFHMSLGVVRQYRTFTNYIFTGEARCAGCLCTCSGMYPYLSLPASFPLSLSLPSSLSPLFPYLLSHSFLFPQ